MNRCVGRQLKLTCLYPLKTCAKTSLTNTKNHADNNWSEIIDYICIVQRSKPELIKNILPNEGCEVMRNLNRFDRSFYWAFLF